MDSTRRHIGASYFFILSRLISTEFEQAYAI